ncbi:MAG TPA: hypothetical protein VLM75_06235 [Spirochaetota bacterium]|nr:hypothetical protein [Spirochaetota bacterium]
MGGAARDRLAEYEKHREFWQNGLQVVEEVSASLESSLALLEKKYADFDSLYNEAMDRIDTLAAIYAGVNTIQGREYVLRLKALMREYKNRYSLEGINFNALYFLHSKIKDLRNTSFSGFPSLDHSSCDRDAGAAVTGQTITVKHRWVTFERNGSCFIVPYDRLEIIEYRKADLRNDPGMNGFSLHRDGAPLEVRDIFASTTSAKTRPAFFVIVGLDGIPACYAASGIGKKILSRRDIISPALRNVSRGGLSRGSLRLFGRNHLFIHPNGPARLLL